MSIVENVIVENNCKSIVLKLNYVVNKWYVHCPGYTALIQKPYKEVGDLKELTNQKK